MSNVAPPRKLLPLIASFGEKLTPLGFSAKSGTVDFRWEREWRFDGEVVTCPWHGMEFRVTTGQCLVSSKIRLRARSS